MKKGFTLIELLAVIVILAVIALIATPIILGIISDAKKSAFKDTAYGIIGAAKNKYIEEMYSTQSASNITFTYTNNVESSSIVGKSLNYSGAKPNNGIVLLTSKGDVSIAIHDGKYCAYKKYSDDEVKIEEKPISECAADYNITKGVNVPTLAQGMTPIKWSGGAWISTTVNDPDWYNYDTTNKIWANAKTADDSMWVWVPRYAYQIATGYHTSTAGTINIKFLQGTDNTTSDGTVIATNPTYSDADTQSNYIQHPAFTFGITELTGIWVAKFEATATEGVANGYTADGLCPTAGDNNPAKTIKVVPNVVSWRCLTIGNMFTSIRSMETKAIYGWTVASGLQSDGSFTTDTNNLDVHLMKNIEWGAAAYLSKSSYGKGIDEIWINPANNFTTGCAGDSAPSASTTGCLRTYEKTNGLKASTTGNINGIYDMSGGANEFVAAYINNNNINLTNYGTSIINAQNKYKDIYDKATIDDQTNNYPLLANKKGDALWETSNNYIGNVAWFSDYTNMPFTTAPWFMRGGRYSHIDAAGPFYFSNPNGNVYSSGGFRPVIVVGVGL